MTTPHARVNLRLLGVGAADQPLGPGMALASPGARQRGAVAAHVAADSDVPSADLVPLGPGGVVEAVVVAELGGKAGVLNLVDGPGLGTAVSSGNFVSAKGKRTRARERSRPAGSGRSAVAGRGRDRPERRAPLAKTKNSQ